MVDKVNIFLYCEYSVKFLQSLRLLDVRAVFFFVIINFKMTYIYLIISIVLINALFIENYRIVVFFYKSDKPLIRLCVQQFLLLLKQRRKSC